MLVTCVFLLAACQKTVNTNSCVGWQEIPLKVTSAKYLTVNDMNAALAIGQHKKFGQKQGCW